MHTAYRSVLGQINWLQSRTQFHIGCQFSRCASKASSPTIEDVRGINKTVRTIKSIPLSMRFWPLRGRNRIVGYPDASYCNNEDKSSQRAHVIFLAEQRDLRQGSSNSRGSLVEQSKWVSPNKPEQMEIQLLRDTANPSPFWNHKSLSVVKQYYRECRTTQEKHPEFNYVPEHVRGPRDKPCWLKTKFNDPVKTYHSWRGHPGRQCAHGEDLRYVLPDQQQSHEFQH